jgi:hypothetical protein
MMNEKEGQPEEKAREPEDVEEIGEAKILKRREGFDSGFELRIKQVFGCLATSKLQHKHSHESERGNLKKNGKARKEERILK